MDLDRASSMACRLGFFGAFALLAVAVLERGLNVVGYTMLGGGSYAPGRLAEFASILMAFVIALLIRQLREILKQGRGATG